MSKAGIAVPPEGRQANHLKNYFAAYPERGNALARVLFRRGEEERFQLLQSWLTDWEGLSVLDAGCGDGVFLSRVISGRPRLLRLEDLVEKWTVAAREYLQDRAESVEAVTADVMTSDDDRQYDLVLALGVFDYSHDWPELLRRLLERTNGMIVADFPKSGTLHSRLRKIWLGRSGVRLHSANRDELERLFAATGVTARIAELPLQWVARIDRRPCPH